MKKMSETQYHSKYSHDNVVRQPPLCRM